MSLGDYTFIYGGVVLTAVAMIVGTFIIIKLDERPSKPKKKHVDG